MNGLHLRLFPYFQRHAASSRSRRVRALNTLFSKWPSLQTLRCGPDMTDEAVLALVRHCGGIRELDIRDCDQLTDRSVSALSRLSELRRLYMSGCCHPELTAEALLAVAQECAHLEVLEANGCSAIDGKSL